MADRPAPRSLLLIACGGVGGTVARHGVAGLLPPLSATLAVNVVGSFALGVLLYADIYGAAIPREARLLVATGFLSSLTTYSTFAVQTVHATPAVAAAYVAGSYGLGFAAVALGRSVALRLGNGDGPSGAEPADETGVVQP